MDSVSVAIVGEQRPQFRRDTTEQAILTLPEALNLCYINVCIL